MPYDEGKKDWVVEVVDVLPLGLNSKLKVKAYCGFSMMAFYSQASTVVRLLV